MVPLPEVLLEIFERRLLRNRFLDIILFQILQLEVLHGRVVVLLIIGGSIEGRFCISAMLNGQYLKILGIESSRAGALIGLVLVEEMSPETFSALCLNEAYEDV